MPKKDLNQLAKCIIDRVTREVPDPEANKNPKFVAGARKGGLIGGKARASKLSAEQRKDIASKASRKCWKK